MKQRDPVTVLLGVGLILAVLAAVSLVAGGVMKLFGFTYDSVGSLVLYFVAASVLSAVFGQVFSALPKVLYEMGKLNRAEGIILYLVLTLWSPPRASGRWTAGCRPSRRVTGPSWQCRCCWPCRASAISKRSSNATDYQKRPVQPTCADGRDTDREI